jgi:hypothetical protein
VVGSAHSSRSAQQSWLSSSCDAIFYLLFSLHSAGVLRREKIDVDKMKKAVASGTWVFFCGTLLLVYMVRTGTWYYVGIFFSWNTVAPGTYHGMWGIFFLEHCCSWYMVRGTWVFLG